MAVQHLLGLATGLLIYLLLARRGLPRWGAALAAAPVLLDGGLIELESLVLSDTLFLFLVVAALAALLWPGRHPARLAAAGLLLSAATTTRTIGLPLLLLALLWLLLRRRWRAVGLVAVTGLLPLVCYAGWFHSENGRYGITATDGVFLWGRTAAFVRCENISEELRHLCPEDDPRDRKASSSQVWARESPIGWNYGEAFDPQINKDAQRFAVQAILEQPLDYAGTVAYDFFVRTFRWERDDHPTPVTARKYLFPEQAEDLPTWPVLGGGTPASVLTAYDPGTPAGSARVVEPYARSSAPTRRRHGARPRARGGPAPARPPGTAAARSLRPSCRGRRSRAPGRPPLTVDFDHRYALTATPIIALAAAYAFTRPRPTLPPLIISPRKPLPSAAPGRRRLGGPTRSAEGRGSPRLRTAFSTAS